MYENMRDGILPLGVLLGIIALYKKSTNANNILEDRIAKTYNLKYCLKKDRIMLYLIDIIEDPIIDIKLKNYFVLLCEEICKIFFVHEHQDLTYTHSIGPLVNKKIDQMIKLCVQIEKAAADVGKLHKLEIFSDASKQIIGLFDDSLHNIIQAYE